MFRTARGSLLIPKTPLPSFSTATCKLRLASMGWMPALPCPYPHCTRSEEGNLFLFCFFNEKQTSVCNSVHGGQAFLLHSKFPWGVYWGLTVLSLLIPLVCCHFDPTLWQGFLHPFPTFALTVSGLLCCQEIKKCSGLKPHDSFANQSAEKCTSTFFVGILTTHQILIWRLAKDFSNFILLAALEAGSSICGAGWLPNFSCGLERLRVRHIKAQFYRIFRMTSHIVM